MFDALTSKYEVRDFTCYVDVCKAEGGPESDDMEVSGPVASEQRDLQGDTMLRVGIWKSLVGYFKNYGAHVDWEHLYVKTHDPKWIIGRGKEAVSVDGRPWLVAKLFKSNPIAIDVFNRIKDGARIGYSIVGSAMRDPRTRETMTSSIKFVTLAPLPIGADQYTQVGAPTGGIVQIAKALTIEGEQCYGLEPSWRMPTDTERVMLAKAMMTGSGIVEGGDTGGAALRTQALGPDFGECGCTRDKKCKKHQKKLEVVTADTELEKALCAAGVRDFRTGALDLTRLIRH